MMYNSDTLVSIHLFVGPYLYTITIRLDTIAVHLFTMCIHLYAIYMQLKRPLHQIIYQILILKHF